MGLTISRLISPRPQPADVALWPLSRTPIEDQMESSSDSPGYQRLPHRSELPTASDIRTDDGVSREQWRVTVLNTYRKHIVLGINILLTGGLSLSSSRVFMGRSDPWKLFCLSDAGSLWKGVCFLNNSKLLDRVETYAILPLISRVMMTLWINSFGLLSSLLPYDNLKFAIGFISKFSDVAVASERRLQGMGWQDESFLIHRLPQQSYPSSCATPIPLPNCPDRIGYQRAVYADPLVNAVVHAVIVQSLLWYIVRPQFYRLLTSCYDHLKNIYDNLLGDRRTEISALAREVGVDIIGRMTPIPSNILKKIFELFFPRNHAENTA